MKIRIFPNLCKFPTSFVKFPFLGKLVNRIVLIINDLGFGTVLSMYISTHTNLKLLIIMKSSNTQELEFSPAKVKEQVERMQELVYEYVKRLSKLRRDQDLFNTMIESNRLA
jgi:hypothetical protein